MIATSNPVSRPNTHQRVPRAALRIPRAARVLGAVLALALGARAGVVLTGDHKTLDGSQPAFTYTVSIDKDKVRMESSNTPGSIFIYRADKGVFWMVDGSRKTYTEMTRKDLESMAGAMDAAMRQMQEQLATLPPEQRAMMEKMMKENMPGAADAAKPTYKKIGAGKVGSWACEKYESYVEGKKKAELCVVDPKVLGFTDADFQALKDMAKPFEKFAKDMQAMMPQDGAAGSPKGAPVRSVIFVDGKAQSETLIKQAKKDGIAANAFDLPAGYTKQAMAAPPTGQ